MNRFECEEFDNIVVIIGGEQKYNGMLSNSVQYYDYSRKDFLKIIDLCKSADMVVLYSLNSAKAYIANRLPKSVVVLWRFFGLELYHKIPEYVYSEKTLEILKQVERQNYLSRKKLQLIKYLAIFKYRAIRKNELNKAAFSRIDFFLGISRPEHEFLKGIWKELPPFLQHNMAPYVKIDILRKKKTNLILLGNNRSPSNNHLDIIDGIKESNSRDNFDFLMMFNYGSEDIYSETIRKKVGEVPQIKLLEEFLTIQKFKELYATADAFVMNGHRQMAMGNILEALQQNIKIYLNEKNLTYHSLKEEGFVIFTIKNFLDDLDSDNVVLSQEDCIINQERLVKMTAKYDKLSFQKIINNIIREKNNLIPQKNTIS